MKPLLQNLQAIIRKLNTFFAKEIGLALIIAVLWQIFMLMLGILLQILFSGKDSPEITMLSHMKNWDAGWYLTIMKDFYHDVPGSSAFYPLYPLAVSLVNQLSLGVFGLVFSALLVNTISLWVALIALFKISESLGLAKYKWVTVALFICSPTAFFMHAVYTEAFFSAIAFWSYYMALKRKWLWVGILLGLLTATRLPALLFVILALFEFFRAYDYKPKRILNKNILYFGLAPLGFIAYGAYLSIVKDNFFAMFNAYKEVPDWDYQQFSLNFFATLLEQVKEIYYMAIQPTTINAMTFVDPFLPFVGLAILFVLSVFALKHKQFIPLGITGLVSIIFYTLNSNINSVHRYLLPSLTIYIVYVYILKSSNKLIIKISLYGVLYIALSLQIVLYAMYQTPYFAG
jgi:Gpi18-like mannosyltransferase